jgi:hypothetical protein
MRLPHLLPSRSARAWVAAPGVVGELVVVAAEEDAADLDAADQVAAPVADAGRRAGKAAHVVKGRADRVVGADAMASRATVTVAEATAAASSSRTSSPSTASPRS